MAGLRLLSTFFVSIFIAGCNHWGGGDGGSTGQPGPEGPFTLPAPQSAHAGQKGFIQLQYPWRF
eukprot:1048196-Pelagomonas_calceolata.AAC.11